MKIRVYLDSGANIHSCYERIIDLENDLGINESEWAELSEYDKDYMMKEFAFESSEWGYYEIKEESE